MFLFGQNKWTSSKENGQLNNVTKNIKEMPNFFKFYV